MGRQPIPHNVGRQLWASCGGYCQNPQCNRFLFASVDEDLISLANVAHIIGYGIKSPRSNHELADEIDKNGLDNLIMLCLDCHKIIDELAHKFSVEEIKTWKTTHEKEIKRLFNVPEITNERELLVEVSNLLDENGMIFREYGPYSEKALEGDSGDALIIWRRRCLDTILPNNRRVVDLIEKNKKHFPFPWDVYKEMMVYRLHVDAFEDNCLLDQRVNDYKLFPVEFDHFIKTKLGVKLHPRELRPKEELEFRRGQISIYINRFLCNHDCIADMKEINRATMHVTLKDGRELRVFVTNTYVFTEYTFDKILAIDPYVEVILCSNPSGEYTDTAKQLCIENKIGLFKLREFMGAVRKTGEDFLNYLLVEERNERISHSKNALEHALKDAFLPKGLEAYLFGSFLRRKIYRDIDVLIVYKNDQAQLAVERLAHILKRVAEQYSSLIDITICSSQEFPNLPLKNNNLTKIYSS
ncbi:MAG: nucleotidyltransferase domain-containing protein [Chloroflexaceae bacterium]|nr:nucleotidyltransferase domain-containing protein [Chloroflexaceae bacterium]